jgi:hypothetical protein
MSLHDNPSESICWRKPKLMFHKYPCVLGFTFTFFGWPVDPCIEGAARLREELQFILEKKKKNANPYIQGAARHWKELQFTF